MQGNLAIVQVTPETLIDHKAWQSSTKNHVARTSRARNIMYVG